MKNVLRISIIACLLILTGCQKEKDIRSSSQSVKTTTKTTTSQTSSSTSNATTLSEKDNQIYDTVLTKVKADQSDQPATHYVFLDIDKNGSDELITGRESQGTVNLAAIYYNNNGVADYLAQSLVSSAGGSRESAEIYDDGTVLSASWTSTQPEMEFKYLKLKKDNTGFDIVQTATLLAGSKDDANNPKKVFHLENKKTIDPTKFKWKKLSDYSPSGNSVTVPVTSGMDVKAIQQGDYSSIAGTWQNSAGWTLEISKDKILFKGQELELTNLAVFSNYLKGNTAYTAISFAPKGVILDPNDNGSSSNSEYKDVSDPNKDRIFMAQTSYWDEKGFFYRSE